MRNFFLITFFILAFSVFFLSGCFGNDMSEPKAEKTDEINNENDTDDQSDAGVFEGDLLKSFYLEDNSGNSINSSDLAGKATILNFWTSWSLESENVNELISDCYKMFEDTIHIVSVNVTAVEGHNLEYVIKYIRNMAYEFPVYFDLEGDVAKKYLIRSFPTTYLIDEEGYIAKIYIGEINEKDFVNDIKDLVK